MVRLNGPRPPAPNAPDIALYIGALAAELARLAERYDLTALAYLLSMARLEADQISRQENRSGESLSSPR